MAKGEAWLKAELVKALEWDESVVDGVVDVISKAESSDEVQNIVNDYMENNALAITIISDYMEAKTAPKQRRQQQSGGLAKAHPVVPPSPQSVPTSYSASVTAAPKPYPAKQAAAAKLGQEKWLNLGGSQAPLAADEASQASTQDSKQQSKEQAEVTLAMFKKGGKVKPRSAASLPGSGSGSSTAGSSRKGQHQLDSLTANLERKVANCLSCGKIYDCRNVTNDIIKFIHDGFHCTFCGSSVAMTQQQQIQQAQQQQLSEAAGGSNSTPDSATVVAIAFKDRLVDYDRNAQQRTTVIDNQSDYFEIDTNAWLSEEERAELRRREQLEEEAAAARRNKVFVTLDLLGRKVLTAEGPSASAAGDNGYNSSIGAAFQIGAAADPAPQSPSVDGSSSSKRGGPGAAAGVGKVDVSGAVGSDSQKAVESPIAQVLMDQALASIRDLRITANPTVATPPPVFVPVKIRQQQQQQQHQQPVPALDRSSSRGHDKQQKQLGKADADRPQKHQQQQRQRQQRDGDRDSRRGGGAAARAAAANGRIQDDSIFIEFEAELLYDDLLKQQRNAASSLKK